MKLFLIISRGIGLDLGFLFRMDAGSLVAYEGVGDLSLGLTIYGNKGTATADFEDFKPSQLRFVLDRFLQNEPAVVDYPADLTGAYGQGDVVRRYMQHFEDCIVDDKPTLEDAREGTKTTAALSAAWESARTGKPVKVSYEI